MPIKVETIGGTLAEISGAFSHTEIYVGFVEDFETINKPKDIYGTSPAANLSELVKITEAHAFKTGSGFTKIKAIQETVGLETTQVGDSKMSPVQENKLTIQILGSEAEILGFKRLIKGRDLIVLAPEFGSGNVRQIGSAKYAGKLSESSSKIEPATEGENTTTLVFMDKQTYDAPIYTGAITVQT